MSFHPRIDQVSNFNNDVLAQQNGWPKSVLVVVLLATILAGVAVWSSAVAQTATAPDGTALVSAALVRPNDMNSGGLLLPSKREGWYVEAPRLATDVDIRISGPIARIKVTQRFENPSDGWTEGVYVFPLPEQAAVDRLKMQIGTRLIEGIIKPRQEARQIYEQAKREGRKAALLEQERANIFTNSVANIGPGETVIVQIEYQEAVHQSGGEFSLRFPMVVAPRFNPKPIVQNVDFSNGTGWGQTTDPVPDRDKIEPPVLDPKIYGKINPIALNVRLAAGFRLGEVVSHHHAIVEREEDRQTRVLTLAKGEVPADKDFELSWKALGKSPSAALFKESGPDGDYILAFVTPPATKPDQRKKIPREVIFVIDNSGSMAGPSMEQAKQSLALAIQNLEPIDRFNIVRFDDTYEILFPLPVEANLVNTSVAQSFVSRLTADGGTMMLPALQMALADADAGNTSHVRQVVFLTDGAIGNEQELFDEIARGRGRSRVFTVGIGSAPNSFFMNRAAEIGRGTFTHIGSEVQVLERMTELFEKLRNPVVTNLNVRIANGQLMEMSPDPLPDLYFGEPVVLAALMPKAEGQLMLTGMFGDQPWQVDLDLAGAAQGEGIGKLWARRKIASIEARKSITGDYDGADRAVEKVALAHHLVSRMTSLVALDINKSRPQGEALNTADVPLNLPDGWDFNKVFDENISFDITGDQAMLKQAMANVAMLTAAAPSAEAAAVVALKNRVALSLPQTATPAERYLTLGFLLLMFAAMVYLTARLWRNAARKMARPS